MNFHQFSIFLGKNGDLGLKSKNEVIAFEEESLFSLKVAWNLVRTTIVKAT